MLLYDDDGGGGSSYPPLALQYTAPLSPPPRTPTPRYIASRIPTRSLVRACTRVHSPMSFSRILSSAALSPRSRTQRWRQSQRQTSSRPSYANTLHCVRDLLSIFIRTRYRALVHNNTLRGTRDEEDLRTTCFIYYVIEYKMFIRLGKRFYATVTVYAVLSTVCFAQ